MTYREESGREGWDFNTETAAGKRFLEMRSEHVLDGADFYGLTNEEIGFYFIKRGVMTNQQFKDVFDHLPDMTP